MTDLVAELADRCRALPPEERVRLLDLLLESLGETSTVGVEDAWNAEIERRVAAHELGEGKLYDAKKVMAEAARIAP
jgi:putative addiction module component (TIGR02574 family)